MIHVSVITRADPKEHAGARQWKLSGRPEGLLFQFATVQAAEQFRVSGRFATQSMSLSTRLPRHVIETNEDVVPAGEYRLHKIYISVPPAGHDFISARTSGIVSVAELEKVPAQLTSLPTTALWAALLK